MKSLFVFLFLVATAHGAEHHARHGFVLMADQPVLYHLARFNSPHQYQGLFTVSIKDGDGKEIDLTKLKPSRKILSIVSTSPFSLEDDLASHKPFSFSAELYDGYLRGPDKELIANVTVERLSVIYFKELSNDANPVPKTRLITFCNAVTNRFYAAHLVEGSPNFEELFSIEGLYSGATGEVSVVYPCWMDHMGSILTIVNRPGDQPLKDLSYLDAYSPGNGHVVQLASVKRLLFDDKAINAK